MLAPKVPPHSRLMAGRDALDAIRPHPEPNRSRWATPPSLIQQRRMTTITTPSSLALVPSLETAWQDVDSSFERFCLTAGIGAIEQMLCEDAQQLAGAPHNRSGGRVGHRWGRTKGKI